MGNVFSVCSQRAQDLGGNSVELTGDLMGATEEFVQPFTDELIGAIPVLKDIYNAMKNLYNKYTEFGEMKEWLRRLTEDVELTAKQVVSLSPGSERTMLEKALREACDLLDEVGVGALMGAKDVQRQLQDIANHLHQRKSSATFGLCIQQDQSRDLQEQLRVSRLEDKVSAWRLGYLYASWVQADTWFKVDAAKTDNMGMEMVRRLESLGASMATTDQDMLANRKTVSLEQLEPLMMRLRRQLRNIHADLQLMFDISYHAMLVCCLTLLLSGMEAADAAVRLDEEKQVIQQERKVLSTSLLSLVQQARFYGCIQPRVLDTMALLAEANSQTQAQAQELISLLTDDTACVEGLQAVGASSS